MRSMALLAGDGRWHEGGGGPPGFWGPVVALLFLAFVAVLTWLLLRARPRKSSAVDRGREILAERFARGELTAEEYRDRREELR